MPPRPTLRRYQADDLGKIVRALNSGQRRVLYQLPTGGGKTVVFADLIRQVWAAGLHVLVLTHRDEIMQQVSSSLRALGVRHGVIAPGYPRTNHRVQVASVMSLVRRLDWVREFDPRLVVVDEAHHIAARTWTRILEAVPNGDILGVTATPRRLDGKPLDEFFDVLIIGPSIASLIDQEFLSAVQVFTPARSPDLSQVHVRAGDYAVDEIAGVMSNTMIVDGAVDEYKRLCAGVPGIAFCVDIRHSKLVADAFKQRGYRAAHVDGATPTSKRRELIAALDNGSLDILSNCGLISEGLDVPGVVAAILLRPTQSLALYLQMVGRALRPAPDKDTAFVLDHAGNVYRHGLPTATRRWTLHGRQQQDDTAAAGLVRCRSCGAMNPRGAEQCAHCGAALGRGERQERVVVPGRPLVQAVDTPINDADLARMTLRDALQWCADNDGCIRGERAARLAHSRGYKPGWAYLVAGKPWRQVYAGARDWARTQPRSTD